MVESDRVTAGDIALFLPGASTASPHTTDDPIPEVSGWSLREMINAYEEAIIVREYERCGENVSRIAAHLKIDRANLHRKLKLFGIK